MEQIFTEELSGADSIRVLRKGVFQLEENLAKSRRWLMMAVLLFSWTYPKYS